MAIGEQEDGAVAFGGDHGQKPFTLLLGEEMNHALRLSRWRGGGCRLGIHIEQNTSSVLFGQEPHH